VNSKELSNMLTRIIRRRSILPAIVLAGLNLSTASAQLMPKAQVANLIVKIENGVDEFRNCLDRRGESAPSTASTPQAQARVPNAGK
jgi:hypothetical protein